MAPSKPAGHEVDRRRVLSWMAAGAVIAAPRPAAAAVLGAESRRLSFVNLHTGERLAATFWANGAYDRSAVADINHLLRDFRTGDVYPINVHLLDLLHVLHRSVHSRSPFQVISGYRSPATNSKLAAQSNGVARQSYHMKGMAIDVALEDRKLKTLRDAALALEAGGVGYYPKPGFVHVDVGPVRSW